MLIAAAVVALLQGATTAADSAEILRRSANRAAANYESMARWLAPVTFDGGAGHCDEIVGRFCLRFDDRRRPPPEPEPAGVVRARRDAVEALRRAFSASPDDFDTAGPLVRYLIEDGRPDEAVAAARSFAWAAADSVWGDWLVGFALHAAGDTEAATRHFSRGLEHMPPADRREIQRLDPLLAPAEVRIYRDLDGPTRAAYETAVWRLAEPLYLRSGNERLVEHYARHVWSRILAGAPLVPGAVSWGNDLHVLTLRYGVPSGRSRVVGHSPGEVRIVERYDPDQLALLPSALESAGPDPSPAPGEAWRLGERRARSRYRPRGVRHLAQMPIQLSRLHTGAGTPLLRWDGALPLDSVALAGLDAWDPERVKAALFVLDAARGYEIHSRRTAEVHRRADTLFVTAALPLAPGEYLFSLEVVEPWTGLAGRARYPFIVAPATPGFKLSDPVLVEPGSATAGREFTASDIGRPHARLVFPPGRVVGIHAELVGLTVGDDGSAAYRVELRIAPPERSALARAARRIRGVLGLASVDESVALSWEGVATDPSATSIRFDLPLPDRTGLHTLELEVTDLVSGTRRRVVRQLRIQADEG